MFADFVLARRIEAAEASLSREVGEATAARGRGDAAARVYVRDLAGGVAVFTGTDSPITKVIGVGFEGVPSDAGWDEVEREFFARGAAVRAEVATLADPALCAMLSRRGYLLEGFENVLGCRIDAGAGYADVPGVEVGRTTDLPAWNEVVIEGFEHPDTGVISAPGERIPREVFERIHEDMAGAKGLRRYFARLHGAPAGGGTLRVHERVAQMAGAATVPAARRRGVHTALLNARLRDAARAGCDIAVVTTQPGSQSQENVQRRGFALLYTRAVLVKRG
jgi:GNAT superfamily N-acetyltransferase